MKKSIKRYISLVLCFIMFTTTVFAFSDMDGHWAKKYVDDLYDEGVTNGYPDGTFRPDNDISVEEFATFLDRYYFNGFGRDGSGEYWADDHVDFLEDQGLLEDYGSQKSNLTRIVALRTIIRCIDGAEKKLKDFNYPPKFNDVNDIEPSDYKYVNFGVDNKVVNGYRDRTFRPDRDVTRAEAAKLLFMIKDEFSIRDEDDEYVEKVEGHVEADLEIDAPREIEWNYKDYESGTPERVKIILDASDSTSILDEEYEYEIEIGKQEDSKDSSSSTWREYFEVTPDDVRFGEIDVEAKVTVTDEDDNSDTATDSTSIDVEITNERPNANFTAKTQFKDKELNKFYLTLPVKIRDFSSDYEDDKGLLQWVIKKDGRNVLIADKEIEGIEGTNTNDRFDFVDSYFENDATIDSNGNLLITFKEQGIYEIEQTIYDIKGKRDTYSESIFVWPEPSPPTAIIDSYDYAFINEPLRFKDASTDPNDDICKWDWSIPTENTTGSLSGKNGGYLTFTKKDIYEVGINVTDQTDLSNSTTKQIKVIPEIPVAVITSKDRIKVNRKLSVSVEDSLSPKADPVQSNRNEWVFEPLEGQNKDSIKIDDATSTDTVKNVLFKETGQYKVKVKLHNNFTDANPDHEDILARETELVIDVFDDEKPEGELIVQNANPNFVDNPVSIDVTVKSNTSSPDNDIVKFYKWNVKRDNNEDGDYSDEDTYFEDEGVIKKEITFPVKFELNNNGLYKTRLDMKEEFGQETIDKFVTDSDRRENFTESEFSVNWIADVKFSIPEFAYTDDILPIETKIKDERVRTCKVDWSIKRANETNTSQMDDVDINTYTDNILENEGGAIRFKESGYYELIATITDELGQTSFYKENIRIYPLPTAVISDKEEYRFKKIEFNGKEKRRFDIHGNNSFANDYYGQELHPIDHTKDYWEIIPLDNQSLDSIKILDESTNTAKISKDDNIFKAIGDNLDEKIVFREDGRYKVRYKITNEYGKKSPFSEEIINVEEDKEPVIISQSKDIAYRNDATREATLEVFDIEFISEDEDLIDVERARIRFASNNDGNFKDETWSSDLSIVKEKKDDKLIGKIQLPKDHVGNYQFELYTKEEFGQPTIAQFVTDSDKLRTYKYETTEIENIKPQANFNTISEAKVDVVFAVGEVSSSKMSAFQANLRDFETLLNSGSDYIQTSVETVKTSTISSADAGASAIFNTWTKYPLLNDGKFNAGWGLSGDEIYTTANVHWTGFWDKANQEKKDVDIEFDVMTTGHQDPWGFTFRMTNPDKTDNDVYSFYALEWGPYHNELTLAKVTIWKPSYSDPTHGGPVYHGTINSADGHYDNHGGGDRVSNALRDCQGTVLKSVPFNLSYNRWDHTRIVAKGNHIQVWVNGNKYFDIYDNNSPLLKGAYGPYTASQYNTHFKNVKITSGSTKGLDEALKDIKWRDNTERFIINFSDKNLPELNSSDERYPLVLTRLIDYDAYLINLGTSSNESQFLDIIRKIENKGTHINNYNISSALNNAARYILDIVKKKVNNTMYILVDDKVHYEKIYKDYEKDPQFEYPKNPIVAEKWFYDHDKDYYDNSLGLADFNRQWRADSVDIFDKVGLYVTNYKAKDNPLAPDTDFNNPFNNYRYFSDNMDTDPAKIYVHRKPIAQFRADITKDKGYITNINITDSSYDLDHQFSHSKKGIKRWEWKWKKSTDTAWQGNYSTTDKQSGLNWINNELTTINVTSNYIVSLRVQDIDGVNEEGAWSEPMVTLITNEPLPPIAQFELNKTSLYLKDTLVVKDTSYDPNGDTLTRWEWKLYRNDSVVRTSYSQNPSSTFNQTIKNYGISSNLDLNKYKISLKVTDDKGYKSDLFTLHFRVIPENLAPNVDFNPIPNPTYIFDSYDKKGNDNINFNVVVSDPNDTDGQAATNNTGFKYNWTFENFKVKDTSLISDNADNVYNYTTKIPFSGTPTNANLDYGAYRITLAATDTPPIPPFSIGNEKTTSVTKTWYVIPTLDIEGHYSYEGIVDPVEKIVCGETVQILATTNKFSDNTKIIYNKQEIPMTLQREDTKHKYWIGDFTIPEDYEGELITVDVKTDTEWGGNGTVTREKSTPVTIKVLPVKLYDFAITNITDYAMAGLINDNVYVKDLAYDENNNAQGKIMKKGYGFYFELKSKGLKNDDDSVRIRPSFYAYNESTKKYDIPLDMYYKDKKNNFIKATTETNEALDPNDNLIIYYERLKLNLLGYHRELNLPVSLRTKLSKTEQQWKGRYGIPANSMFVQKGTILNKANLYKGKALVHFDIDAVKAGKAKYNYVGKNQWHKERVDSKGSFINSKKSLYQDGAVIVIDASKNINDDFESRPVWKK